MSVPPIITYIAIDTDAPGSMTYAAAMVSDGRPGTHWMAHGPTPEAARGKLEAIWAKQFPAPGKRGLHLKKKSEMVDDFDIVL